MGGGEVNSYEYCSWLDCFHCKGNVLRKCQYPPSPLRHHPKTPPFYNSSSAVLRSRMKHDLRLGEL